MWGKLTKSKREIKLCHQLWSQKEMTSIKPSRHFSRTLLPGFCLTSSVRCLGRELRGPRSGYLFWVPRTSESIPQWAQTRNIYWYDNILREEAKSYSLHFHFNIPIISGHPFSQWFNLSFLMRLSLVNLKYVFSLWHLHLACVPP